MKKIGLLAVAALLVGGMSSCVKDYDCTCTVTYGDGSASETETIKVKGTKKTSETLCEEASTTSGSGETEVKSTCKL